MNKRKKPMTYKVVIEKETAGGYSIYTPELPGCASQGETMAEAVKNIRKAIKLYLWSVEKDKTSLQKKLVLIKNIAA